MSETIHPTSDQLSLARQQYRLFHDIYVFLDAGDTQSLTGYQLTPSQFTLLMLLDPLHGQNLIRLAERMLVARSTITRLIDQLEGLGLVHRVNDPNDRRAQRVALTERGAALCSHAFEAHERSLQVRFEVLPEDEQLQLRTLLSKLRDSLLQKLNTPTEVMATELK